MEHSNGPMVVNIQELGKKECKMEEEPIKQPMVNLKKANGIKESVLLGCD